MSETAKPEQNQQPNHRENDAPDGFFYFSSVDSDRDVGGVYQFDGESDGYTNKKGHTISREEIPTRAFEFSDDGRETDT